MTTVAGEEAQRVDVAGIENRANVSVTAAARWRSDLPLELAKRYARDIHGVLDARFPGIYHYRQHAVASRTPVRTDVFTPVPGVAYDVEPEDQLHCAHLIHFLDEEAHQACSQSKILEFARSDNLVLVDRNYHYVTEGPGQGRTYVDRTGSGGTPQGPVEHPTFAAYFRKASAAPRDAFDLHMRSLAERWAATDGVLRVRLELLGDVESQFDYDEAEVQHAWIDLVVADEGLTPRLLGPDDGLDHAAHVAAIQTLEISELYTIVFGGRATDVGLRGYPAVQTIEEIGAHAQKNVELLKLLYGPAAEDTSHALRG